MADEESFDFNKPLDFEAFESSEDSIKNIVNAHVWHELGHLFAYCLTRELKFDLGNVISISLKSKPKTKTDESKYFVEGYIDKSTDCFGFPNIKFLKDPDDLKLCEIVNEDIDTAIAKLIILISGGLFNIYPFVTDPNAKEFDDCYSNILNPSVQDCYKGCAGNDWDKSRKIACCLKWSYVELVNFRYLLFRIYRDSEIFEKLTPIIESLEPEISYDGPGLQDLQRRISELIERNLLLNILELIRSKGK